MVEAVDFLQTLFRAPNSLFRVKARCRRSRHDQVDYWEGVLHLLYNKICLKQLTMAPEAHGAQVLPDPEFRPKNMIRPH